MAVLWKDEPDIAIIPKDYLRDPNLSTPAKGVLTMAKALDFTDLNEMCFENEEYLMRVLRELETKGYLTLKKNKRGNDVICFAEMA